MINSVFSTLTTSKTILFSSRCFFPVELDRVRLRMILSFRNSIPISIQFEHVDGDDQILVSRFGVFHRDVARVQNDSVRVFSRVVDRVQSLVQMEERIFVESGDHQSAKSNEKISSSYTQSGTPLKRRRCRFM
jgi:hypothetical protein